MFVRTSGFSKLGAALMTRDVACAQYAPGSFGWNRWNCGAGGPASPGVATVIYAPAPAPAPSAPGYRADDAAALRAQAEYNARIAAELSASEAARAAAQAQAERDAARAALANNSGAAEIGEADYSNFGTGVSKTDNANVASTEKMPAWVWLAIAGVGVIALSNGGRRGAA